MKGLMVLSNMLRVCILQAMLGGVGLAGAGQAHDVWITFLPGVHGILLPVINHGHPGDRKAPDPDKLYQLRVIAPSGPGETVPPTGRSQTLDGVPVLLMAPIETKGQSGTWIVTARYDNGYWVKTAHGYRNTSKLEFPNVLESVHSMKLAKALIFAGASADVSDRAVGHRLELVSLDDPFALSIGDMLHVRVLFEGKPMKGLGLEIGDGVTPRKEEAIPRYHTNADGIAALPIGRFGLQVITVDYKGPSRNPALADADLLVATLSFVITEK